MVPAFSFALPLLPRAPCVRRSAPQARALSDQDREYVEKVRQRLLHATSRRERAVNPGRVYERPNASELHAPGGVDFAHGIAHFNAGRYAAAAVHFRLSATAAGRDGGRALLWLAQALDAAGDRKGAAAQLEVLCNHADEEVAATAAELLFILSAPRLELSREAFVELPPLVNPRRSRKGKRTLAARIGTMTARRKIVEKYSLEWYMKQPLGDGGESTDAALGIALGVAVAGAVVLIGALR